MLYRSRRPGLFGVPPVAITVSNLIGPSLAKMSDGTDVY
jgi:hypothetical protein